MTTTTATTTVNDRSADGSRTPTKSRRLFSRKQSDANNSNGNGNSNSNAREEDDTSRPKQRSKTPPVLKRLMTRRSNNNSNTGKARSKSTDRTSRPTAASPKENKQPPRRRSWGSMKERVKARTANRTGNSVSRQEEVSLLDPSNHSANPDDEHQVRGRRASHSVSTNRNRSKSKSKRSKRSSKAVTNDTAAPASATDKKVSNHDEIRESSIHEEDLNDSIHITNDNNNSINNNNNNSINNDSRSSLLSPRRLVGSSKRLFNRIRSRSRGKYRNSTNGNGSNNESATSLNNSTNAINNTSAANGTLTVTPPLYRRARKCRWQDVLEQCQNNENGEANVGAKFVSTKDGTTALHMAVMSRTGYLQTFKSSEKELEVASLQVVEELIKLNPDAAKQTCTLNGYTPLTYACLVCSDEYDVQDAAKIVELFVRYTPECFGIFTTEGLSPIDVHIVSYSHHHADKEELDVGSGKTSTTVLRLLLMHSAEHANLRLREKYVKNDISTKKSVVEGPIEYLYKCNAEAFSETVMDEIYDSDEQGSTWSDFTTPVKRQHVVDKVSKWWVWKWAVMILKYGSLKQKRKGARFAAVHTAAWQVGCPVPLLTIALYAFPRQVKQTLESKDGVENLPIHLVCAWPCPSDGPNRSSDSTSSDDDEEHQQSSPTESVVAFRKSQAIARLIEEYPEGAKKRNNRGETPLELALQTRTTWDMGIRRLVRAFPKAIKMPSKKTGLFPFMIAAAAADNEPSHHDLQSVRTIYGLLRSSPKVLAACFQEQPQQQKTSRR